MLNTTASTTRTIFTLRILFIHCIRYNNVKDSLLIASTKIYKGVRQKIFERRRVAFNFFVPLHP